jgi:ATP-dependent DNA ligase
VVRTVGEHSSPATRRLLLLIHTRRANLTTKVKPRFIEPMLLLRTEMLPEGPEWGYQIKLDGYRAVAFKTGGMLSLRSRNDMTSPCGIHR